MGFFSDLKADLSLAVDELLPQEEKENEELQTEEVVEEAADEPVVEEAAQVESSIEETSEESIDDILAEASHYDLEGMLEKALKEEGIIVVDSEEETASAEEISEELEINEPVEEVAAEPEPEIQEEISEEIPMEIQEEEPVIPEEPVQIEEVQEPEEIIEDNKGVKTMTIERPMYSEAIDETAVISSGMTINGDVISDGNLDLIGTVTGNIDIAGKLNVTGGIQGKSRAAEIFADGAQINGDIEAAGSVKIGASSVVVGNIVATSAAIAGAVKGDIDVQGPVILDTSAIVMGNIKSKSVQINNGAVIEGMCSQCYAEVSPTSFFDDYKVDLKKPSRK